MDAHNLSSNLYKGTTYMPDPGSGNSIYVDKSPIVCNLSSSGAETRTLARPTRGGAILTLHQQTDGGDITLTVTGGYNEAGDTTFTFSDVGQFATFISLETSANVFFWRLVSHYGMGNASATEFAALDGLTATVSEINQYCDESARVETVTATNVITAAESGKTFFLDAVAGFLSTLPAPAAGLEYTFIVKTAPTSNGYTIATNGGSDIIVITVNELETDTNDDGPSDDNADLITLVANIALPGDRIDFRCDGTKWYAMGQTVADGAVTTATS